MTAPAPTQAGLRLSPDERDPVALCARAFAEVVPDRAEPYRRLAEAATAGEVPGDLVPALERVCELALSTGRARDLGRAEAERALAAVLGRTPRGAELARRVEEVNRALSALAGRRLRAVRVSQRLPGRCLLRLEAEGATITLGLHPEGVGVESLEVS
jgi:hypothetical protein